MPQRVAANQRHRVGDVPEEDVQAAGPHSNGDGRQRVRFLLAVGWRWRRLAADREPRTFSPPTPGCGGMSRSSSEGAVRSLGRFGHG
mmetsp:Transcript_101036/g.324494  ORF Transcript_101036/g.324494 Transcript_101036/m.324494 type:complete len:87 (+) Transcript_101036:2696-2956(+)